MIGHLTSDDSKIFYGVVDLRGDYTRENDLVYLGFVILPGGADDWGNPRALLMNAYIRREDVASVFDWKIL